MILKNLSIDCVIFGFDGNEIKILLTQQNSEILKKQLESRSDYDDIKVLFQKHPTLLDKECWSVFGAHVPYETNLDTFANELINQVTGMNNVYLKQFHCFGDVSRVSYFRVVTVGYYALINPAHHTIRKSVAAKELKWFDLKDLPKLSFDHEEIIQKALSNLQNEVRFHPIGFHLLPTKFTLTQFQTLYEVILNKKMDTRNFRKKISNMHLLEDTGEKQQNVSHRAAKLYRFDETVYNQLKEEGLKFRIE